jgi:hypothetical protein
MAELAYELRTLASVASEIAQRYEAAGNQDVVSVKELNSDLASGPASPTTTTTG